MESFPNLKEIVSDLTNYRLIKDLKRVEKLHINSYQDIQLFQLLMYMPKSLRQINLYSDFKLFEKWFYAIFIKNPKALIRYKGDNGEGYMLYL